MTSTAQLPALALLAGGLATRLRPVTERIPKSMIEVAGEPFIAHQLRLCVREGVRKVVICAGYLAEQIEVYVGKGDRFGIEVAYSTDWPDLLGTGGAIKKALPLLGAEFFVMYGDSYLDISFAPIHHAFVSSGKPALMTVFRNRGRWDASNIEFSGGRIRRYDKTDRTAAMEFIDYGLSVFSADAFKGIPANQPMDLVEVLSPLIRSGELAGYEVTQRFYEIGTHAGLSETETMLNARNITRS